jgi:predicted house-cleaning noncanonical NTP pyrophosphatase (MazG superfamily)
MAWTVEDLRDLAELLRAHPEWREPLWALLASEEVRRMPERMERSFQRAARLILALYRAQRQHYKEFIAHRAETDRRFAELAEAIRNLSESFAIHRAETDRRFAELAEAQRRHYEEFVTHRAETDRRFAELAEAVRRLSESFAAHRQEFLEYRAETDRRFAELAEAQRRTEESLAAHRAETDRRFAELAEAVRRLSESFAAHRQEFLEYRAETDRRFAELAEAQRRTEESLAAHRAETDRRFAELAEAQRRTEEILQQVLLRQEQFQRTLDHFGQIIGPITEEHMVQALQEWIAQQGGTLLTPVVSITLDGLGEVDGLARARLPDGREAWLLVSAKAKVWARSITEFVERILRHPEARERLQAQGVGDPVLPVVFGRALDHRALEAAQRARVGLLIGRQGMLVPPALWSLSEGKPLG